MVEPGSAWHLGGGPGSRLYALYDHLRGGVNRTLLGFFRAQGIPMRRVLEAGSGPGEATSLIGRESGVATSVACDLDRAALGEGRRRDPALRALRADLYRLPVADGAFDLVWSSSTLEHFERRPAALAEMARVCAPGGHVFVGVPYRYGPLFFQPLIARSAVGVWLGPVFSRRELAAELEAAGLRPVAHLCYFFAFFVGILARKDGPR